MREAKGQIQVRALLCAAVADALNLQSLVVFLYHTVNHVRNVGAGQAVEAARLLFVIRAGNHNLSTLDLDGHHRVISGMQGTLGALDGDGMRVFVNSYRNTGRGNS